LIFVLQKLTKKIKIMNQADGITFCGKILGFVLVLSFPIAPMIVMAYAGYTNILAIIYNITT
jgi:uncharacterized membrane protein YjfL (UPF0719 family)